MGQILPKISLILDETTTSRSGKELKRSTPWDQRAIQMKYETDPTVADVKALAVKEIDTKVFDKVSETVYVQGRPDEPLADDAPVKDIKFLIYEAHIVKKAVIETPAPAPAPEPTPAPAE